MKKITDLEHFTVAHIISPYLNAAEKNSLLFEKNFFDVRKNPLKDVLNSLKDQHNKEWADLVLDRIRRIDFFFPSYIQHPLVDFLRKKKVINEDKK